MLHSFYGKIRSPEFTTGLSWLNTATPLSMKQLKGKIVLLDFFTYCCINCMHVLPDLEKLERLYPNELVVIGVHSPKFENEKVDEHVKQAILRYQIKHPVVCDPQMSHWQEFGIRAWPTLVLIDPAGYAVGLFSGEGNFEQLRVTIADLINQFRAQGQLDESPMHFQKEAIPQTPLLFPGKVLADPHEDQIWVSDSNHQRVLAIDEKSGIKTIIGSGQIGSQDGSFETAQFFNPQGLCRVGDFLFIADTDNHLIRRADLNKQMVETVAGTGSQAHQFNQEGMALKVALNSPWDLVSVGEKLYIAMAGSHQIWSYHLKTTELKVFAGSGREACIDGPHRFAALAQPSGLTTDQKNLYVADSEVSAIRQVPLNPHEAVSTLVGHDLFIFGDVDGQKESVRLQHPLGVCYAQETLYIADTYNHKIKSLDLSSLECKTLQPCFKEGVSSFFEPSGLSIRKQTLYIADTNHHRVLKMNLETLECYPLF